MLVYHYEQGRIMNHYNRRDFISFMGHMSVSSALATSALQLSCTSATKAQPLPFVPLLPSTQDDLVLAPGLHYNVLIKYDDPMTGKLRFGTHNDFLHFTPIDKKPSEGLLWVNHEYIHPVLIHNRKMDSARTKKDMEHEQKTIGGSILHIEMSNNKWSLVAASQRHRRIDGTTPISFSNNVSIMGSTQAIGMVTNCGGGFTPWNTILTCEENYDIFYGDAKMKKKKRKFIEKDKMNWYTHFPRPPEHYGWVVEVNPFTGAAKKHTALGRFEHEGATVTKGNTEKIVVYMGEDRKGGGIFKFISNTSNSIDTGTLYVANTEKGHWIPLDYDKHPKLQKHFHSQLETLIYASRSAELVGGTPQDRPEDIEIDPKTKSIIIALTKNPDTANIHGGLLKIDEKNADPESLFFTSQMFKPAGPEAGFSCPDNLVFDNNGNLWMTTDMSEDDISAGKYPHRGNNGLFFIPMSGPHAGCALQVASAPMDAEFTGPTFSPDFKTLFLSVQHPGAETKDPLYPTSRWPEGAPNLPKSSVVTLHGKTLEKLTSANWSL